MMTVNSFKIPIISNSEESFINIPIDLSYQPVDNSELIEKGFVDMEVENVINPIVDYDRVRYLPLNNSHNPLLSVTYDVKLLVKGSYVNHYGDIGFSDEDIKFRKNNFKHTYLNLAFYDSDNPMTQNLVSYVTIYSELRDEDFKTSATGNTISVKSAKEIPVDFLLENPLRNPKGFCEGFHLYYYKENLRIGESKYLYMKASFKNSKTGKSVNLMVKDTAQSIDQLIKELYTRFILTRTNSGYYYIIDDKYRSNVMYSDDKVRVSLYEVRAI